MYNDLKGTIGKDVHKSHDQLHYFHSVKTERYNVNNKLHTNYQTVDHYYQFMNFLPHISRSDRVRVINAASIQIQC